MKKISYTKNPAPEKPSEQNSESLLLFLFHGTEFPEVFASFFCLMERNFDLFSLPWNGSEQNSKSLLLFLFHGTEFRAFFSSAELFRSFMFRVTAVTPPEQTNCSLYSVFCRKLSTLTPYCCTSDLFCICIWAIALFIILYIVNIQEGKNTYRQFLLFLPRIHCRQE